jgi:hypothetical protein
MVGKNLIPRFLQHLRGSFNQSYCLEVDDSLTVNLRRSLMSRKNILGTHGEKDLFLQIKKNCPELMTGCSYLAIYN